MLLVRCTAFRSKLCRYRNLTIKKIPKAVLSRCEWGKENYSLQVENLPKALPAKGQMELIAEDVMGRRDRDQSVSVTYETR